MGLNRTEPMTVRTEQKWTGPDTQILHTKHGLSIHLKQCLHYVFNVVENN